jgi:site-specific DNA-methyltransferase (adenine-specific)
MSDIAIKQGDCLEVLRFLANKEVKVDAIICDPPYGTTACKWDSVIPLSPMWGLLEKLMLDRTPVVLFGSEPFSSNLRISNLSRYKYDWVWEKNSAKGHFNAKKRPLSSHEMIHVFYSKPCTYNFQKSKGHVRKTATRPKEKNSEVYGNNTSTTHYDSTERYPRSVIKFGQDTQKSSLHPTQKPVALMEYLVKTYSNEGDTILDFAMGSGTTGVACQNLNRNFIGIEKDAEYFEIAKQRLNQ